MKTNEYLQPLWDAFERFADLPAVVDNSGRVTTYRQLGELTRRIAGGLASLDLPENSFIPILLPTSMEYIAAEMGVWMAGHAVVPMGTTFPEGRIEYIKEHCEAPLVIDAERLKALAEADELRDEVTRFEPEQKAMLIYTSGSTGEPKGILHCFDSLCSHVHTGSLQEEHTDMVWGTSSPFYFVAAMSNFPVLKGGGQLHFYTGDVLFDVRKLEDYIEEHGVTHTFISPAVLANFHNRSKSLKVVFTGSEKLVNQCSRDGYLLYNNYGMTETLGTLLHFKVDKPYESTPVGVPNQEDGTELMLVGEDGKPVAEGEEGELVVKGCFCKGYYKDPEHTAQLYQDGWLHTNDILRRLPDGNYVYVNRKDWMVKINGQRVEPGEVEQAIQRIDGVTKAIVKGFDGKTGSQYLCGYYTSDGDITPEEIRKTLAERLPPYMVPLHIVKVDQFSFLPNGKVNRKALLPPDSSELLSNYVAPTNEVERTLCEAFAQALGMEQVGIDDDFFMLGGDSIKVMRLQQACESLNLTSKMIYKGKTPRHIAELCDVVGGEIAAPEFPVALSQTQMGIYAESMARQGEAAYNNPILLKISAEIDEQKLAQAIEQVVSAHAFIKTRIEEDAEGNPVMTPSDAAYQQTIEQMSEAELEVLKPQLIQPFNLQKDLLFRIRLIRTEAGLYLFTDFHHIIYDGTSMRIFMADVDRAYAGETIAPEQWTGWHVAQEETALRQTEAYTEAKAWYEETFSGLDIENKPIPDVIGEKAVTFGSQDLLLGISNEAINVFCRRQGVTANILALAAFAKLMGAYTNQEAALFTTIYNGRNSLRTARTIDMMVKTLPVYSRWTADTRIKDFLYDVKQQLLGAMNNDIYSFAEVAANLGISSDVLFAYQGDYLTLGTVCGQPYDVIPLEKNATGSPIDVQVFNTADGPSLHVEYQKNMYSDGLISELMQCYANVLRSMLTVERLADIELLNADQLQQLDSFNDTDVEYDDTQTVVSLFRRQAKATPDAEAVVFKDKRYTYQEVDEISDRIAGYIASKGLGLEDAVSVIIPRCEWMVIASLGVLKAGCTYQPLDPTYPKERLNFMVKDADAKLLIADESLLELVDEYQGEVLLTKELPNLPNTLNAPSTQITPNSRFILLYTSGSTGVPKGCQLTHGNLVCYCHWYWRFYGLKPEHNVAEYASYGFDAHMDGIYPPLTAGATVHIIPEELRLDLIALNEYFETNHITQAVMTTQVAYQFATSIENHSLLHLTCGGEKLASFNPPTTYQLNNAYGPTETTILVTIFPVHEKLVDIPIGKAVDNARLYITDLQGHRLPIGAIGELWVAGPQVARGYLNRPEKTAEVFITNPFTREKKYAPVYRTGDIVRYMHDGNIQFVGRRDGQVKIRGFRVELKEVEAVIREFPGIKDATVQAFDAESGGKFIAAYIVSDEQINIEALNNFIREQKPPYMVPAVTMQIDAIPLNQNQKVNKRALPKPEFKKMEMEESGNRSLNVLEQELLEIAAGVIGNKEFGVTTPLIYAGLTSILSIKLSVQLYKRFGMEIKSNQLTGGASIESIENVILDRWMNGSEEDEMKSAKSAEDEGPKASPLTFAQTGVYFECVKNPLNVTYSMPSLYRFDKKVVSAELLEKVLSEFISIHPALSTHFDMTEDGVMQVPNEDQTAVIEQLTMTPSEFEEYKQHFLQPFRLSSGPLYRLVIITVEDEVYLLADFHHLVMDGDSMNTFTIQLGEALRGEKLEAETLSYAKFAEDEKRFEASEGFEANKTYFAQMLAEYESASEIAADIKGQEANGLMQTVASPFDLDAVDGFAKQQGVTPASVMLAATFYTVSRYINSRNVYLSTISSGRSDVRTAGTVGMFVNTLPLGITVADTTVTEFIKASADVFKGVIEHEKYPFARIAADYGYQPHIVFEYQIGVIGKADIPGLKSREALNNESAKFKLAVHIEYRDGKPAVVLYYNDALYSRALMEGLADSIAAVAERMMSSADAKVRKVSIVSKAQETELAGLRQTASGEAPFKLFHECIGHFAETQPDHEALVAIDGTFTYQQMDEVTNRIANALRQKGVQERDRVALLLPRTSRLILSLFGVLKAGAAYIPCDPEYPADRIKLILEDSEAKYIITTADRLGSVPADKAIDVESLLPPKLGGHRGLNKGQSDATSDPQLPNLGGSLTPDDLAYLIYTSGSTGRPKGVMLRHEGICNYLYGHPANVFANAVMTDAERILSVTTISFDAALQDIGMAYFNGKTLILATEEQANNPLDLAKLIAEQHINMVSGTPSRWGAWLMSPDFCKAIANLAICRAGGEKFSDQLLSQMRKATKARIFNCYGPTEITVASNNAELTTAEIVTVGKPQLNVKEFIVDSDGNELPVGVVGELYIGGRGVARGYNNLDEMTRERFVDYKGERIYKSGDYAKWLPDGNVVILGRTDHQIKLRGLRIELGEIENVMLKVEGMKKVVILIRKINDREHLCAYYTADREIAAEDLKAEISKSLTQYMVPTAYLQLKEMPMTPNGKTDVKALPNPELAGVGEYVVPANDTEQIFCDIFAGILKIDKVGATDSFFELGGTSLAVMQIVVQAEKAGLHVAYRDVFDNPSPRQLARLVTGEVVEDRHDEVSDFDYTAINNLLQRNTLKNFLSGECRQLGNVLLTGATGYLGIHILNELVESDAQNIYCLVRGKTIEAAEHRLNTMLYYYFNKSFAPLFGTRLHIVLGDVTSDFAVGLEVDTVFNCAAIVKHFSEGTEIEDVNIGGAQHCVEYCIKTGARLIHISTASTRGIWTGEPKDEVFTEQRLYIGQYLNNKYIYSKFMAERLILEAIALHGLDGKIMRVGNLAARSTDGEFQANFSTNSFMGRIRVFNMLGCCSYAMAASKVEFSPINEVSRAIVYLATTPKECTVFHPYNNHVQFLGDVLNGLSIVTNGVRFVELDEFNEVMNRAKDDPEKASQLASLLAYADAAHGQRVTDVTRNNDYTTQVLLRLGSSFSPTSWDYVERMLTAIEGFGFFE